MPVRRAPFVAFVAILAVVAGCGAASSPQGRLRVMNAVTGAPSVDVLIDGALAVGGVSLPGSSDYQSRATTSHDVRVVLAGTSQPVVQATVPLAADESVTLLASGVLGGSPAPVATALLDDDSAPAPSHCRLRLVHAAAASASRVFSATLRPEGSATPAAPAILAAYRTGAYFLEVPAGRYVVDLADAGGATIATFPTGPLAAGDSTTALATDAAPGAGAPVTLTYFTDRS